VNPKKLLAKFTNSQTNIRFGDLVRVVEALGFERDRVAGSHHLYIHREHREAQLNLQPSGSQAKPYQVKQLLKLVEEYHLVIE
jgi:predicted RNA binding protein YcfA (HicA-like mRNA interferase family)